MRPIQNAVYALIGGDGRCGAASADVLYSNFAEGDAYDTTCGWTLSYGGPLGGDACEDAVPFTGTGAD